jgi:undecaprenyl-diphosphatase
VTYSQAAVLGLIQGLTEFLPVSSSGHLVLVQSLYGWKEADLTFDIVVHLATLVALVVYYRRDVYVILKGGLTGTTEPWEGLTPRTWCGLLLLGSIPAAVVGLAFKSQIEAQFADPVLNGIQLLITAAILFSTVPLKTFRHTLTWGRALWVGVAQAISILPGISRSGATIATAMHLGVSREQAARYSFLLSMPAIFGAFLLQAGDIARSPAPFAPAWGPLLLGFVTSLVSGYLAVAGFVSLLSRGRFAVFGWWCIALGLGSLWWFR